MPEGPEIRRAADQVEKALQKGNVLDVYFAFDQLKGYESILKGASVIRVDTKGKAMLIRFDNGYTIYSHNQLYGKWYVRNVYNYPKTNRQLRLALHNEKKSALLYSASDIEVLRDEEVPLHPFIAKVGPDLLSEEVTAEQLKERFQSKAFSRKKWTSLLLDQSFIGGIGNYLRSEILFLAGIHPDLRPVDCSEEQLDRAAEATVTLVTQSYEHNGITNDLDLANKLKKEGQTRREYRHWVFNREAQPCRIDGTEIEKVKAGSRRLYYCPTCQAKL
ncbi:endonuclease VIII [Pseudalkalibacillus hwajinpoensis]|uniref:DNA-(apurinic or apyrimidinic site) lyase n=1 Tax=Guptibacillus hwajinpoensis TaxID=208199 RepID=A0A4U1MLW2_9BACL|nr:endonuclease VIII [Pseudalkalibacillus hwajinpoensis]TKD72509.1 endonuclease VIII [Pseudalkalibacillus hwajinpoensis]